MSTVPLRRSLFISLFVAVTWASATFAVAGLLAVLLDRNPIETPDVPVYIGLAGIALAGVAVWLIVGYTARSTAPWIGALAAAASVYLLCVTVAFVVSFPLFVEQAASPFVFAAAALAAVAVVATWAVLRPSPKRGLSGPEAHT